MSDPTPPPMPSPTWRDMWNYNAPRLRYWLVPAMVALIVLAPLMRDGLPVTQLGLIPTHAGLADVLDKSIRVAALPFRLLLLDFNPALAMTSIGAALLMGAMASRLWQGHGWWVASLTLTLPFFISTLYQRGDLTLLSSWIYFLFFPLMLIGLNPKAGRLQYGYPLFVGVLALFQLGRLLVAGPYQALAPYQLFLVAWADPLNWREWVGAPSFQVGVVPIGLGVLTVLAAIPRRQERPARIALILVSVATLFILLTLLPGPVLLWLTLALMALMVAIGALPWLDARYASLPVQLGIVAIAVLTIYPYLHPAWFDNTLLEGQQNYHLFGEQQLWLARSNITRTDDTLAVNVAWQALKPIPQNYSVFVHFVNAQGEVVSQADALLADADGTPTTQWAEGYVVSQAYQATVSEPIQEIRLGVYDVPTLQRLPISEIYGVGDNRGFVKASNQDYISFTDIP